MGILHGFSQDGGTFIANKCSIANSEVILEADGTDSEAAFSGLIVGYDGYNKAKTNGISLVGNKVSIDDSVDWGSASITSVDGVTSAGSWGLTCDTYTHGSSGTQKVYFVAEVGGYQYETLADAIAAADPGDTVTVLQDIEEGQVDFQKNVTVDLGTHTWTGIDTNDYLFTVSGNYEVAIKNGAMVAPKFLGNVTAGNVTLEACDITENNCLFVKGGQVFLKNTDLTATASNAFGIQVNDGMFTLDADSSITAMGQDYATGVFVQGSNESAKPVINIYGTITAFGSTVEGNGTDRSNPEINIMEGAVLTAEKLAMYLPQPGVVNITGASVTGYAAIGIKSGTLNIKDSTIHGVANDNVLGDEHSATNGIATDGSAIVIDSYVGYAGAMNLNISGDSHIVSDYSTAIHEIGNNAGKTNVVSITVNGGYFSSASGYKNILVRDVTKDTVNITAGYFTSDPSEYVDENMAAIPSDLPGYAFTVGDAVETEVKPAVGAPSVELGSGISETDEQTVQNAAASVKVEGGELAAAANSIVTEADKVKEEAIQEYKESDIAGPGSAEDVNVYAQTYLNIKPTAYDVTSENKTLTMDITPMYRVVASTETSADALKVEGEISAGETANAVVLKGSEKELTNIQTMTITLTLPSGFTTEGSTVYIQHKGYEYTATANGSSEITFTNPHGFSEFTFSTQSQAVAKINGTSYTTLQAAVDAVKNGETITLLKNDLSATVSKAVTFKVASEGGEYTATFTAGNGYVLTDDGNGNYVVTYAGGGGSATEEPTFPFKDVSENAWYYDAVKYVYENSIMAGTGDVTFDPEVKLTRAMAVQILYNLEGKPEVTTTSTFTDLDAGAWYIDAVNWASANGVVAGMGDNTFAPDINVSREQFAQMMYNYAAYKKYDVSKSGDLTQFPDNGSVSSWATTAMSWANGNGLINGTELSNGSVVLDPQGTAIRAQAASILMNFDKNLVK